MMRFIATAEHTRGASVSHPCTRGVYDDPVDFGQFDVEAGSLDEARELAQREMEEAVARCGPCDCQRHLQPGSCRWWESVCISLWPQDQASFDAWVADGGDADYDPYGLIPVELK